MSCVYKEDPSPHPTFSVFHPSHSLNRIEIKHASVFVTIIFLLNWRFYFVNIEVSRRCGQMILINLASTSVELHTYTALPRGQ